MKKVLSILLTLVMIASLGACGKPATEPQEKPDEAISAADKTTAATDKSEPIVITDALGRKVELPAAAKKNSRSVQCSAHGDLSRLSRPRGRIQRFKS